MRVKTIIPFKDLEFGITRMVGQEFDVSNERGKVLIDKMLVEEVKKEDSTKEESDKKSKKTSK